MRNNSRIRGRETAHTHAHFGVAAIFANASLRKAQLERRIKDSVMKKLPYVVNNGEKVVHEESQGTRTLDETKKWRYSELTVIQHEGSAASAEAVMHWTIHSFLIAPYCILPEAWGGEEGCMQTQLAALLEIPASDVEYDFTLLRSGWEAKGGPNASLLLAYCGHFV